MRRQLFLSHAWATDECGRDVHRFAIEVATALRGCGWTVWLDEWELVGNIDACMCAGIDSADVFVVLVTRRYCEKVAGAANATGSCVDACHNEWNYARTIGKPIVPIVLEPSMRDTRHWQCNVMQMQLGTHLYINGVDGPSATARRLHAQLLRRGIHPSMRKKAYDRKVRQIIYV